MCMHNSTVFNSYHQPWRRQASYESKFKMILLSFRCWVKTTNGIWRWSMISRRLWMRWKGRISFCQFNFESSWLRLLLYFKAVAALRLSSSSTGRGRRGRERFAFGLAAGSGQLHGGLFAVSVCAWPQIGQPAPAPSPIDFVLKFEGLRLLCLRCKLKLMSWELEMTMLIIF